jgi:predicted MFS family arabinose efflux permease
LKSDNSKSEIKQHEVDVLIQTPRRSAPIPVTRRVFRALGSADFRLIFFGSFLSNVGTWLQRVAQSWLIFEMSNSAFLLGLDAFASDIPLLLFSLFGGVAADRFNRRKLLAWTQALQLLLAAILALLAFSQTIRVWHIISISFLFGCVQAVSVPTYMSFMPGLVKGEDLSSALALNSIQFNLSRIIGPAIAGYFLIRQGAGFCFLLNSLSFLAVIASLFWMKKASPSQRREISLKESMMQGAHFVRHHKLLQYYLISVFAFSFCASPLVTLLPLFARDILQSGATGFSQLLSFFGIGAIVGAFWVAGAENLKRKIDLVIATVSLFVVCAFAFGLSRGLLVSSMIALVAGGAIIAANVMLNTMVQHESPEALRGRIMSMYGLAFRGGMPLGNLLAGAIAQRYGGPAAVHVQGILMLLYTVFLVTFFRPKFSKVRIQ